MPTPIPPNGARLTAWSAAAATGGRPHLADGEACVAEGIVSNSQAATRGAAFVALRGARRDGHDYVAAAIDAGASLLVVEEGRWERRGTVDTVEVADTLTAWGDLARAHLRGWRRLRHDACVLAITGSAGKTTTKEFCSALLREVDGCLGAAGNLNNRVGVPAVAFCVRPEHRFAVFELGMSLRGEIALLAGIVEPEVAILTNVSVAHAEGVGGSRADVAREKGDLFAALSDRSVAVVCADDAAAVAQLARTRALRAITFGAQPGADYQLVERRGAADASDLRVSRKRDGSVLSVRIPVVGEAAAVDFCGALAAVESVVGSLDPNIVNRALRTGFSMPAGRMQVRPLANGMTVLDDTYNANPQSFQAALGTLIEVAAGRPTVIVVGEMRELGAVAWAEHVTLGSILAQTGARSIISCGGLADVAVAIARDAGMECAFATDAEGAATLVANVASPADVVLVKASRGVGAERVVEALVRAAGGEVTPRPESL